MEPGHSTSVDILIVGAGMVGTPLALALADQGWRVALCDAAPTASLAETAGAGAPAEPLQQRCTALSARSMQLLEQWGLGSRVQADANPIHTVHVSQKGYLGATRLRASEMGVPALGWVVDNARFVAAMQSSLADSTVAWYPHTRASRVEAGAAEVAVQLQASDGVEQRLASRLLIAVDGIDSIVRTSLGIDVARTDYDQAAVLGTLRLDRPHQNMACERFTANGPLALLPRPDNHASFVCCTDADDAEHLARQLEPFALSNLQRRFGYRLGHFQAMGPRQVIPMTRIEAVQQWGTRSLLLGSAARVLHPVAGQGYNLALRDVAECVRQLRALRESALGLGHPARFPAAGMAHASRPDSADRRDPDPGADRLLRAIIKARRADQQITIGLTDVLARVFRGRAAVPAHARSLGLLGLDLVGPLRERFARRTMGLRAG